MTEDPEFFDDAEPETPDPAAAWTIERAAREIGCSRETLRRGLQGNGFETAKGREFTLRQIFRALMGDLKAAKTRESNARAEKLEIEVRRTAGELFDRAEVSSFVTRLLLPVRQAVLELPATLSVRCNPADPFLARVALDAWVDEFLAVQTQAVNEAEIEASAVPEPPAAVDTLPAAAGPADAKDDGKAPVLPPAPPEPPAQGVDFDEFGPISPQNP